MNEIKFVKNPDYPDNWEEQQRKRCGDCFGCRHFLDCLGAICKKTGQPLRLPITGCGGREPKTY